MANFYGSLAGFGSGGGVALEEFMSATSSGGVSIAEELYNFTNECICLKPPSPFTPNSSDV